MFRDSGLSGCVVQASNDYIVFIFKVSIRNLLGLLILEHEGNRILRKVWNHVSNEIASCPRRLDSSGAPLSELQNSCLMSPYKTFGSKGNVTENIVAF
jgi:hypothetical protein